MITYCLRNLVLCNLVIQQFIHLAFNQIEECLRRARFRLCKRQRNRQLRNSMRSIEVEEPVPVPRRRFLEDIERILRFQADRADDHDSI